MTGLLGCSQAGSGLLIFECTTCIAETVTDPKYSLNKLSYIWIVAHYKAGPIRLTIPYWNALFQSSILGKRQYIKLSKVGYEWPVPGMLFN